MSEAWYDDLPKESLITKSDREYAQAFAVVREALAQGLDFDTACNKIVIDDESLKAAIVDDMLKVIIAEEHFGKNISFENISAKIGVSVDRLESTKQSMFDDVENKAINELHKGSVPGEG